MRLIASTLLAGILFATLQGTAQSAEGEFDLVLSGGRVMDPESGLDGLRNVGITAGRIAALSTEPLRGMRVLDVRGLVVAPSAASMYLIRCSAQRQPS